MGLFLFAAAIKNTSPDKIATTIAKYTKRIKVISNVKTYQEWISSKHSSNIDIHNIISEPISITSIHHTRNKWTLVIFNNCQFEEKEISIFLSFKLQTLVSLIKVLDSEVWYHFVFYKGKQVDQFCNNPEEYEQRENFQSFRGNKKKLAFYFDVEEQTIAPYLIPITMDNKANLLFQKAFPDDRYSLGDEWVFVDFWRHLGIEYPSVLPEIVIFHEEL